MKLHELKFEEVTEIISEKKSATFHRALVYYHNKVQDLFEGTSKEDVPSYVFERYMREIITICGCFDIHVSDVTVGEDENGGFDYMTLKYFTMEEG